MVSTQGELVGSEFEETRLILLPEGGAEQAPQDWWEAIDKAARRLLGKGLVPAEEIDGVICTGQWSGTVPVDKEGNALANAIIWMDARGAPYINKILDGPVKIQGYAPLSFGSGSGGQAAFPELPERIRPLIFSISSMFTRISIGRHINSSNRWTILACA